ncbi:hypothetical protein [uncultured Albimonas sp.]|uniref:calcium-binding protein n=1 Tax=uncultured Albimonas sp. TaxID=1331701 RepID=UPI0030EEB701
MEQLPLHRSIQAQLAILGPDGYSVRNDPDNINYRATGGGTPLIPKAASSEAEGVAALGEDGRTLMASWWQFTSRGVVHRNTHADIYDVSDPSLHIEVSLMADVLDAIFTPTDVAPLAGGGWIVGGMANSHDLNRSAPAHVRITSDGEVSALTWDMTRTGNDSGTQVVGLAGGGWASVHIFRGLNEPDCRVLMDVYRPDGTRAKNDAVVGATGGEWPGPERPDGSDALDAVALKDGGFLVTWLSNNKQRVLLQRFDEDGDAVGTRMTLAKGASYDMHAPRLELLQDGRVAFSYLDRGIASTWGEAHAGILDPRGGVYVGDGGADVLVARRAGGELRGQGGDDILVGLGGKDVLRGGRGDDAAFGGGGRDRLYGDQGDDLFYGQGGADRLFGGSGNDSLFGGGGNDRLLGGGGRDLLVGGGGRDHLFGGGGNDVLVGGKGNDRTTGGKGADAFRFKPGDGDRNVITDFGGRDKIKFVRGVDGFRELKIREKGDDVHVVYDGGKVILKGVEPDEIKANDFIFS